MLKSLGNSSEILQEILTAGDFHSIAAGAIAEQFVGQELLASQSCYDEPRLYYWARDVKNSSAEVDYLINIGAQIFPIEVKAGKTGRLTSLHLVVKNYKIPFGIRVSQKKLELENGVLSVPFYAIPEIPRLVKSLGHLT
jgi:predicted AAA+ superfamily ATPase